jgi:hypothetical protein
MVVAEPDKKITVSLDADIVARTRDAVGGGEVPDDVVVERALNAYLLGRLLDKVQARSDLSPEEADRIAVEEVRAHRRERRLAQ